MQILTDSEKLNQVSLCKPSCQVHEPFATRYVFQRHSSITSRRSSRPDLSSLSYQLSQILFSKKKAMNSIASVPMIYLWPNSMFWPTSWNNLRLLGLMLASASWYERVLGNGNLTGNVARRLYLKALFE